jgi:acetate---CoA ligase (ADP-forming)
MTRQQQFFDQARHVAFYGLSGSGKGYAYDVLKALQSARPGLRVSPVHPSATALAGLPAAHNAGRLNPAPDSAVIVLKPEDAAAALDDATHAGIKSVWLVQNAASRTNVERATGLGLDVVQGCPVLFTEGQSFPHNFHRALAKLFGKV